MKRFSIVILIYNQNKQLNCLLKALERQTIQPYEVIVIDNNSSEKIDIGKFQFPIIYKKLKYSRNEPDRRAQARNLGYSIAAGDIVTFFDGDCIPLKNNYLEIVSKIITDKMLLAGFRITIKESMIDGFETPFNSIPAFLDTSWTSFESNNFSLIKTENPLFDNNFTGWGYEDVEMAYRYRADGYKLLMFNGLLVGHIDHIFRIDDKKRATIKKNALYFMQKYANAEVYRGLSEGFQNFNIDPVELNELWGVINA
jgi:glycosyltransferase involved in cell wall biosynthesis